MSPYSKDRRREKVALKWLRTKQKQILVPVAVVVIISFVFLFGSGGGRSGDGRDEEVVAEVGAQKITRARYKEYRTIARVLRLPYSPYYYLVHAEVARRGGMRVGSEQRRDRIRYEMVAKGVLRSDPGGFTDAQYRRALNEHGISNSTFQEFMETVLLAETVWQAVASATHVTEDEYYLAYCRERELVALRRRDFVVSSFEKDVEKPSEEEIREYYDEHSDLDPELETALSTEPEVAIEYAFVEKKLAGRIARLLRENAPLTRPEGLMAGELGSAAAGLTSAVVAAAREGEIRKRYEDQKDRRYKLPDEPDKPGKKEGEEGAEGKEAAEGEGKEGEQGEQGEEEPPKPRYRPLDEVRDEIAKGIDLPLENGAARRAADEVIEVMKKRSHLRTFEADSLLAGLGLAPLPAGLASSALWDRADFMVACEEAGAVHGATGLLKEKDLASIKPLGRTSAISRGAMAKAKGGAGGSPSRATSVGGGYAVWRVADYLASRTLTLEEAKEEIAGRIVHARAERKAREAAEDFIMGLVDGTADLASMRERRPQSIMKADVKPFALLGVGEVPERPVAFKQDRRTVVEEESRERDEESAVMETAHYRVAVVTERKTPERERFEKDANWRTRQERTLPLVRWRFIVEHWQDEVEGKVRARFYGSRDGRR